MNKIGFVVKVKNRGKEYVYLRVSERLKDGKEKGTKRDRNIYSFGNREKAADKMKRWKDDFSKFPNELKLLGYDQEDLNKWYEKIKY